MRTTGRAGRTAVVAAAALVAAGLAAQPATAAPNNNSSKKLQKAVTLAGLERHLTAFQEFAEDSGLYDRAAGSPGYVASAQYVHDLLSRAGYDVEFQEFTFAYVEEEAEVLRVGGRALPVDVMTYSAPSPVGGVTAPLAVVPADADTGCTAADFAGGSYSGTVAVIQRGGCTFATKQANAAAAGAVAAIVYNNTPTDPDTPVNGTIGDPAAGVIPTGGTSYGVGQQLVALVGQQALVELREVREDRMTTNVIAESRWGDPDNVVMAGAHLDSVPEGPGINDNGTGSAALLEVALQLAKTKTNNQLRFAWWSAEEFGLLGAEHYVAELSEEEVDDIAVYLNFDMIGSPNYMFGIYDGDNSGGTAPAGFIPEGSAQIEDVFEAFYASRGLPSNDSEFSGRSDYGPFIEVGIPAGGLFTGAEGTKTPEQAQMYGGIAGEAYDPCYHQRCDSLVPVADGADSALYAQLEAEYDLFGNVNRFAFDVNADAVAHAIVTFAFDTSTVNGVSAPGKSHGAGKSGSGSGGARDAAGTGSGSGHAHGEAATA